MAAFLSTASLNPSIKEISATLRWSVPMGADLATGCEVVLGNAQALEPILDKSFKDLLTLELELYPHWPSELYDQSNSIRTQLSQSVVEEALRKTLSKISKIRITVSVDHSLG